MSRKVDIEDYDHLYKYHNMFSKLAWKVAFPLTLMVLALSKFGS